MGLNMSRMDRVIKYAFETAIKFKHGREYQYFANMVDAMYKGAMQSILESEEKPKEKNALLLEAMIENDLVIRCLTDNIYVANWNCVKATISGKEYD